MSSTVVRGICRFRTRVIHIGGKEREGHGDLSQVGYSRTDILHLEAKVFPQGLSELRESRQLRDQKAELKNLVADLSELVGATLEQRKNGFILVSATQATT